MKPADIDSINKLKALMAPKVSLLNGEHAAHGSEPDKLKESGPDKIDKSHLNSYNTSNLLSTELIPNPSSIPEFTHNQAIEQRKINSIKDQIAAQKSVTPALASPESFIHKPTDRFGNPITYNSKQLDAVKLALADTPFVLIGAAGTGKTTTQQGVIQTLINSSKAGTLWTQTHKYLPHTEVPGIVVIAYTRRAVNNIRAVMPDNMKGNCITFHKLMEYEPQFYEVVDPETGNFRKTMRFEATRNSSRPLPEEIRYIIIEESSMFSTDYFKELIAACPHKPIIICLGDIQQLPPVFGSAILGYKMLEWKTIELTDVYRQALDSPIISLAHRILSGNPIKEKEFKSLSVPGKLLIHPWKKKISAEDASRTLGIKFFPAMYEAKQYNIEEDIILIPFDKDGSCGCRDVNRYIAGYIAKSTSRTVHEIVSGYEKVYLAEGDKVLYDKEDAIVLKIAHNPAYIGRAPQPASKDLNYWGMNETGTSDEEVEDNIDEEAVELMLSSVAGDEDKVNTASHLITLRLLNSDREVTISKTAQVNTLALGYAITIHKSQGSEWKKVFLILHQSHITMLQRELLYTAITRAKEELYIICEPDSLEKGIARQRIKGNTLQQKAEFFKGKVAEESKWEKLK